jgi:hypothetical protein
VPVRTLDRAERTLMEALWAHLDRHYGRPLSGDEVSSLTDLDPATLERAVRSLSWPADAPPPPAAGGARVPADGVASARRDANQPYLEARWARDAQGRQKLMEIRLTVDGQQYCMARD